MTTNGYYNETDAARSSVSYFDISGTYQDEGRS